MPRSIAFSARSSPFLFNVRIGTASFTRYDASHLMNIGHSIDPEDDQPLAPTHDPYHVLRNRDLALYLIGRFVASFGQQMVTIAVGWELYDRTDSYMKLGYVGLTQMLPMILFALSAGHMADSYNRKRIILVTTSIIALA